jgi:hypothetical protein
MSTHVSLLRIAEDLEALDHDAVLFLDLQTGATHTLSTRHFFDGETMVELADGEFFDREEMDVSDRFARMPDRRDVDDYRVMVRFCATIPDLVQRRMVEAALEGKGAFRRFRETVARIDRLEAWYAFRTAACAEVVRRLLEREEIPFEDDLPAAPPVVEPIPPPQATPPAPLPMSAAPAARHPHSPPKESDWKLFRKRIEGWRERYLVRRNAEIAGLLATGAGTATERFWSAEKRMEAEAFVLQECFDDLRRSKMTIRLSRMAEMGVIQPGDLEGFSEDVQRIFYWQMAQ